MKKFIANAYLWTLLTLVYAPIAIIFIFSFTEAKVLGTWTGFSTNLFTNLFEGAGGAELNNAIYYTLLIALIAATVSTLLGSLAAVGIYNMRARMKRVTIFLNSIPMINPDIITGISLMLMFVFVGSRLGRATSLNFGTMLIAHITFCLPYVILQVLPKLRQMDAALPEAAMDLGCTPLRAFYKVELPEILPGVLTGLLMAFTLSLDDFVISYFTAGNGFQTLPIRIYNMTKKTVTPKMYALATIIFFVILALLLLSNLTESRDAKRKPQKRHRDQ